MQSAPKRHATLQRRNTNAIWLQRMHFYVRFVWHSLPEYSIARSLHVPIAAQQRAATSRDRTRTRRDGPPQGKNGDSFWPYGTNISTY